MTRKIITMKVASIIFDLDGTLLDTIQGLADTTNQVLQQFNFPEHASADYKLFIGNGLRRLIENAVPVGTSSTRVDQCCQLFEKIYVENWKSKCCPYDGINAMLDALQKRGIPLAILSNKPHQFTKLFVEEFFPKGTFRYVYGQRDGFAKKPDPLMAVKIAKMLQVNTHSMMFVGDSGVDIRTGKNANMKTAGVSWGFRSVEELRENEPDILINHPLELLNHDIFTHRITSLY
ncbi:MAG: phosphoglycolate phosphatase [Desulforhopalus sp.]|jgi:phosphoglycolate phosphatase